jgi:hypothetical protein
MDKDKKMNPVARWALNVAIAYDELWNARTGGDPQETISSRLGKFQRKFGGVIPWRYPIRKFIVWGLGEIEKDHCKKAIEEDEGSNAVIE